MRRLTGQYWLSWLTMSAGYLRVANGASSGALSALGGVPPDPKAFIEIMRRDPLSFVTEIVVPGTLYALSTELSMKGLAIRSRPDDSCLATHDLRELWDDLADSDRHGITRQVSSTSDRAGVERIIECHRHAFEKWRYFLEVTGNDTGGLVLRDLQRLATGTFLHASAMAKANQVNLKAGLESTDGS